jgi:hypothetical protein
MLVSTRPGATECTVYPMGTNFAGQSPRETNLRCLGADCPTPPNTPPRSANTDGGKPHDRRRTSRTRD